MPADQKEMASKQLDELKTLLKDEKWDELKDKLDQFDSMASQFAQGGNNSGGNNEPQE
jgi:molecular chaperone DnaK